MICLFDTSALVKLVVAEPGSDAAVMIWNRTTSPVASRLVHPELFAAMAGARRAGRLEAAQLRTVGERARYLLLEVTWLDLGPDLAQLAADLAAEHFLSGADAVHLASAVSLGSDAALATFDARLRAAGTQIGVPLLPAHTS